MQLTSAQICTIVAYSIVGLVTIVGVVTFYIWHYWHHAGIRNAEQRKLDNQNEYELSLAKERRFREEAQDKREFAYNKAMDEIVSSHGCFCGKCGAVTELKKLEKIKEYRAPVNSSATPPEPD